MNTNWVREARLATGMTQEELGAWVGMTGSGINRIENGTSTPTLGNLYRIALVLDYGEFAATLAPFLARPRPVRDVQVQDETLF